MPVQVTVTNTIFFIDKASVPAYHRRDIMYGCIVVNYISEEDEPYRTRLTVGGERINYPWYCGTPTVALSTVKYILNSFVSTPNAKFMAIDIKGFYLCTPMAHFEYVRLTLTDLPDDVVQHYKLAAKVTKDGYVYVKI